MAEQDGTDDPRRTLVCDLGGVLVHWDPGLLLQQAVPGLTESALAALAAAVFQGFAPDSDWAQFDRGTVDGPELATRIAARTGLDPGTVAAVVDAIADHLHLIPATARLLERVRAAGHRLVYLSNMPTPYADMLERDPRFRGLFDGGVFSCRVGHVKPEPEIFAAAGRLLALDPAHTVLMDDRPDNLDQARRWGWGTLHFIDPQDAGLRLLAGGWLPPDGEPARAASGACA